MKRHWAVIGLVLGALACRDSLPPELEGTPAAPVLLSAGMDTTQDGVALVILRQSYSDELRVYAWTDTLLAPSESLSVAVEKRRTADSTAEAVELAVPSGATRWVGVRAVRSRDAGPLSPRIRATASGSFVLATNDPAVASVAGNRLKVRVTAHGPEIGGAQVRVAGAATPLPHLTKDLWEAIVSLPPTEGWLTLQLMAWSPAGDSAWRGVTVSRDLVPTVTIATPTARFVTGDSLRVSASCADGGRTPCVSITASLQRRLPDILGPDTVPYYGDEIDTLFHASGSNVNRVVDLAGRLGLATWLYVTGEDDAGQKGVAVVPVVLLGQTEGLTLVHDFNPPLTAWPMASILAADSSHVVFVAPDSTVRWSALDGSGAEDIRPLGDFKPAEVAMYGDTVSLHLRDPLDRLGADWPLGWWSPAGGLVELDAKSTRVGFARGWILHQVTTGWPARRYQVGTGTEDTLAMRTVGAILDDGRGVTGTQDTLLVVGPAAIDTALISGVPDVFVADGNVVAVRAAQPEYHVFVRASDGSVLDLGAGSTPMFLAGTWVTFTRPGTGGSVQTWVGNTSGTIYQVSNQSGQCWPVAVTTEGRVLYTLDNGDVYVGAPSQAPRLVARRSGYSRSLHGLSAGALLFVDIDGGLFRVD